MRNLFDSLWQTISNVVTPPKQAASGVQTSSRGAAIVPLTLAVGVPAGPTVTAIGSVEMLVGGNGAKFSNAPPTGITPSILLPNQYEIPTGVVSSPQVSLLMVANDRATQLPRPVTTNPILPCPAIMATNINNGNEVQIVPNGPNLSTVQPLTPVVGQLAAYVPARPGNVGVNTKVKAVLPPVNDYAGSSQLPINISIGKPGSSQPVIGIPGYAPQSI